MKQLYFTRHGESVMNTQSVLTSWTDTPLTEKGHKQARTAGKKAREKGLSFDLIVSSPLQRAHNTAKHIAEALEYPHENIDINPLFTERSFGSLEGAKALSALGLKYYLDESVIDNHEAVEKLAHLQQRADKALNYLHGLDRHNVLVVSHGAFGRALYRAVNDLPINRRRIKYDNAEIVKFI